MTIKIPIHKIPQSIIISGTYHKVIYDYHGNRLTMIPKGSKVVYLPPSTIDNKDVKNVNYFNDFAIFDVNTT
jgi:hypothetical protein